MKVRDIMTKDVAHINPDAKVTEAAQLMQKHNIGSVPVCDQRGLVGIVTDRDIVVRNIASGKSPQETPVRDVMTGQVNTATPDMDVDEVTKMMATHKIRRVPVVENNQLVGMVSLGDIAVDNKFNFEASEALAEISRPAKPKQLNK
ncbi:MAG: CBS domain-containing protein [Clostridiaceae bacterium]|nr:CBS domain-containing protein [Clostridiaceae bacterium]